MFKFDKIKQQIFHYFSLDFLKKESSPLSTEAYLLYSQIEHMPQMIKLKYHLVDSCSPLSDIDELLNKAKNLYDNMIFPSPEKFQQKKEILQKIWTECHFIHQTLSPLRELNINYDLDLVGGAIRDLLLDKEHDISDLDILISFRNGTYHHFHDDKNMKKIQHIFSLEEIQQFDLKASDSINDYQNKLVAMCFKRIPIEKSYHRFTEEERFIFPNVDGYGADLLESISSFIKLKNQHYPLDILVTPYSREYFLNTYDFDLCRIGLCLTNNLNANHRKNRIDFPINYKMLYSRIYTTTHFLNDVYHHTITYDPKGKSEQQLITSFNNRYPKILKKYPDYTFKINNYVDSVQYKKINSPLVKLDIFHYHMAKSMLLSNKLENNLLLNNVVVPQNKI